MNNHIIRRFELELHVPDKTQGISIQDEILSAYKDEIIQTVSTVLDEFAGPDEFLTIDRLVIDTGRFTGAAFKDSFALQLREVLYSQLERLVEQARREAGKEVVFSDTDAHGNRIEVTVHLKNTVYSTQEILWHWLVYGTLPWRSMQNKRLDELVASLAGEPAMEVLLAELARQRLYSGFQRLALQLKLPALLGLFAEDDVRDKTELLHAYTVSRAGWHTASELVATLLYVSVLRPTASIQEMLVELRREISRGPAPVYGAVLARLFDDAAGYKAFVQQAGAAGSGKPVSPVSAISDAAWIELLEVVQQAQQEVQSSSTSGAEKEEQLQQLKKQQHAGDLPDKQALVIQNAGLVILFPFISTFLTRTGHLENKKFVSEAARAEAAVLLQLLVWGKSGAENPDSDTADPFEEPQLLLNKLLTGLPPDTPLPALHQFDEVQLQTYSEEADKAVEHAIKSWELLKRSSVPSFRKMFLQHAGKLSPGADGWELFIERDSFDVLIDKLPWPISIIRYPWSEKVIYVTW